MATTAQNLVFYYSGAQEEGGFSDSPLESLGGFRSTVKIPNMKEESIFDELGVYETNNGQEIFRCIFLRNEHLTDAMTNLTLYITGKQTFEEIAFGVEIPSAGDVVQMIGSGSEMPWNIDFLEAYTEPEKVVLMASLAHGSAIALWLKRKVSVTDTRNLTSTLVFHFDWV